MTSLRQTALFRGVRQQQPRDNSGQHLRDGKCQPYTRRQQPREQPRCEQHKDQLAQQRHEQRLHTAFNGLKHALYRDIRARKREADRQHAQTGHAQCHRARRE